MGFCGDGKAVAVARWPGVRVPLNAVDAEAGIGKGYDEVWFPAAHDGQLPTPILSGACDDEQAAELLPIPRSRLSP